MRINRLFCILEKVGLLLKLSILGPYTSSMIFEERSYHMGWILIECLMIESNVRGPIVGTSNSAFNFGYWVGLKMIVSY